MEPVKNIIFDLGGVLLTLDYSKTEQSFVNLGVANFNELYNQQKASPLFEQLETGKISDDVFYEQFKNIANVDLDNKEMEVARW